MAILDLFSKRLRRAAKAGKPDVYVYDNFPGPLRVQIVHIWVEAIGNFAIDGYSMGPEQLYPSMDSSVGPPERIWQRIERAVAKEQGLFRLSNERDPFQSCKRYFLDAKYPEAADMVEVTFDAIENVIGRAPQHTWSAYGITMDSVDAIDELNRRLREHDVGYHYTQGKLIRIDSEYIHAEVVKEALALLSDKMFRGPEQEFLRGHDHYRHGRMQEAVVDALKAFESTMKVICAERKWKVESRWAAKDLIKVVLDHGLVPEYLQTHLSGLRGVLEAGLPAVRNKTSGHGQGGEPTVLPGYMAAYALHMAAANIVMLVQAHNAMR